MEYTSGVNDLSQFFARNHGRTQQTFPQESDFRGSLPKDAESSNPRRLRPTQGDGEDEEDENQGSSKRPSRQANTPRHETLYGAIKAIDEDRPECDAETSYMNMELAQREQYRADMSMNEVSGHSSDFQNTQSHWLNKDGLSSSLYMSFEKEKVCNS
jgi:hypothetical protein